MIGGGPIAIEMAQGFTRLGVRTTVLQKGPGILPRDEPELVAILTRRLLDEGVDLRLNVNTERVTVGDGRKIVHGTQDGEPARGRPRSCWWPWAGGPTSRAWAWRSVGVEVGPRGIEVDERMRTSVPSIYAAGDVAGRFLFTHSAGYEAVRAVRDMFFPGKGKVTDFVPWCTFTDPELAHAGLTEAEAERSTATTSRCGAWTWPTPTGPGPTAPPRARIVVVTAKGKLVGAHILAPRRAR